MATSFSVSGVASCCGGGGGGGGCGLGKELIDISRWNGCISLTSFIKLPLSITPPPFSREKKVISPTPPSFLHAGWFFYLTIVWFSLTQDLYTWIGSFPSVPLHFSVVLDKGSILKDLNQPLCQIGRHIVVEVLVSISEKFKRKCCAKLRVWFFKTYLFFTLTNIQLSYTGFHIHVLKTIGF